MAADPALTAAARNLNPKGPTMTQEQFDNAVCDATHAVFPIFADALGLDPDSLVDADALCIAITDALTAALNEQTPHQEIDPAALAQLGS